MACLDRSEGRRLERRGKRIRDPVSTRTKWKLVHGTNPCAFDRSEMNTWKDARVCDVYIYICISQVFTGGKRVDEAETFHRSCPPSFHPGLSKRNRTSGHQASSEFLHVNWNAGSIDRIFHPLPLPRPPSSANWEKHFPPMEFGDFLSPLSRPRKSFLPLEVFIQLFLKCFPTEPNLTRLLIS